MLLDTGPNHMVFIAAYVYYMAGGMFLRMGWDC